MQKRIDRRREVGALVRKWRLDCSSEDVPGYAELPVRSGRQGHVTQEDMAFLVGASDRWYRALEQGTAERIGPEILEGVVRILGLGELQRTALYAAFGAKSAPAPTPGPLPEDDPLRILLHVQPHPAYISDGAWDIVDVNSQAAEVFPWMREPGANALCWGLSPEGAESLPDWLDSWARPMVSQLRIAAAQYPDYARLQQVVRDVREYPPVDRLWRQDSHAQLHPYGAIRPFRPSGDGSEEPVPTQLVGYHPLDHPQTRLMLLVPAPGAAYDTR